MFQSGSSSQLGGSEVLEVWLVKSAALSVALAADAAEGGSGLAFEDCDCDDWLIVCF